MVDGKARAQSLAVVAAALLTVSAKAQPRIDGVAGALVWDQEVRIMGSGFGAGAAAATDDLETGAFSSAWANTYDLDVSPAPPRHQRSRFAAHLDFRNGRDEGKVEGKARPVSAAWSASYWVYLDPNWDWGTSTFSGASKFLSNIKAFRLWSPASINENFVLATRGWEDRMVFNMENVAIDQVTTPCLQNMRAMLAPGVWHHFEFEYKENTSTGAADGGFWMAVDGWEWRRRGIVTREDFAQLKRVFILGWSNVWGDSNDKAPNDFYIDDLYVAPAAGRIVMGDAPVFSACRRREWMPVTAWSETEARVVWRLPDDFPRPAYLYAIGASGILGDDLSEPVLLLALPEAPTRFRVRQGP